MLFRQLFDRESCTYTYILADEDTREGVIIDPVRELLDRDLELLRELNVHLTWVLETHVHADHVTSSGQLRDRLGARTVVSRRGGAECATMQAKHGDIIQFGKHRVEVRATPGHTSGCVTYVVHDGHMAFTGDTLMIRGCGRTDFQEGDARQLYASVHDEIFTLPDAYKLFPAHDYKGRTVTTVAEEKHFNPRLGGGRTVDDFVEIMDQLKLSYPGKIDIAVPANQLCGWLPEDGPRSGAAASGSWAPIERSAGGVPEVTTGWVDGNRAAFRLVDVRNPEEWNDERGHIDGAELVPLSGLEFAAEGWDREAPLVVLCRSGGRSGKAATALENMNFKQVASMAGGMQRWVDESRPVARDGEESAGSKGSCG